MRRRSRSPCRSTHVSGLAGLAAVLLLAAPAAAWAQTVVGSVVERGTARPVPGAFIALLDEEGRRGSGVLSGEDGGYVLRAPAPGRYRLVAEMIGYRSTTTDWIILTADGSERRDLEVAVEAVSLDGIQVETGERCRRRPGSGPRTARLWDEARKALEVARWSRAQDVLRFHVVEHRRELDAASFQVLADQEQVRAGYYGESPYRSVPAERLARGGYIQRAPDGTYDYFAPDAEVLLSESFLEHHCFRVRAPSPDEPELIGLAFEPVPERDLPDIRGVLWLDRGSAELRRLDFSYSDFPFRHGDWSQAGGRVEFERLATGMWIVRRWRIRMPLRADESGGFGGSRRELVLTALSEEGAEIRSVTTRDGTRIAEAVGATLYGTLAVEGAVLPSGLGGAAVEVLAADRSTATADDGAFRLAGLPAGTYGVRFTHPDLVRMGIGPVEHVVDLRPGAASRLAVTVDLDAARAREICEDGGWAPGDGERAPALVYGSVLGPDGATPVPGAVVRVWGDEPERRTVTDPQGAFRFCTASGPRPLRLAAVPPDRILAPAAQLDVVEIDAAEPGFFPAALSLSRADPPRVAGTAGRRSEQSNAILGRVLEEGTDRPVEGALVTLLTADSVAAASMVTDEAGRFKLLHPSATEDRFALRVEHVGYGTVESQVRFPPGQQLLLDILVSGRAIPLAPVVVTGRRQTFLADLGFYDRLERGAGTFIQRPEIERRAPAYITDLLQGRSGIRVVSRGMGYDVRLLQQISFQTGPDACVASIFVDGVVVRGGGPQDTGRPEVLLSDVVTPTDVEAMEVYTGAAGMPQQFGGTTSPCGAVVIWTRRGVAPSP